MTRKSINTIENGKLKNGFDYDLQVWVVDFIIQKCGHPESMREHGSCCNANLYHGIDIRKIAPKHGKQ